MKNRSWVLVSCLVLLVLLLSGCTGKDSAALKQNDEINNGDTADKAIQTGATKKFTISAGPKEFAQKSIRVKKGDKVQLTLVNDKGDHGLKIDKFGVRMVGGDTTEFIADKKGIFLYTCSVQCGVNHENMTGKLIVD